MLIMENDKESKVEVNDLFLVGISYSRKKNMSCWTIMALISAS